MISDARIREIAEAVERLGRDLEELLEKGKDLPAVERNARRMQGTLSILRAHFEVLAETLEG
ncbi:MAG: hypothetical protein D6708_11910 [Candidatus Dadabacteria bacterium]|nr:MAG: hypothetical protein D6708_11910 [Candidatus Dadabacteria bacterium]